MFDRVRHLVMATASSRTFLANSLLTLSFCVFCLYQVQEFALERMDDLNREHHRPRPAANAFDIKVSQQDEEISDSAIKDVQSAKKTNGTNIWITMGLCWSTNTQYHGKNKFPYKDAAPFSSQLWMKLTPARVIMQIVYSEAKPSEELIQYKETLEGYGALVKLVPSGGMKCVLKAQLIRILAFGLPEVRPNDIVVTADVDAFVMTPEIAHPLTVLRKKKIWLYRYELSQNMGYTFMMPFIGARAGVWKDILDYNGSLEEMIKSYGKKMNFSDDYTWDVDQHIVSHAILSSGLCTIDSGNKLWKELNLEPPDPPVDDSSTCWHGSGVYEDCNNKLWTRNVMIRYHGRGCKWWHFYPDETYKDLKAKFDEIMSGKAEAGVLNSFVKKAKQLQKDYFGTAIQL